MLPCLAALIILVTVTLVNPCDYKKISPAHSMCKPKSATCPMIKNTFPESDIKEILRVHNELRAKVANGKETAGKGGGQPEAANMMEMVWDTELAEVAQKWADQCLLSHDCAACRAVERFKVGQNIYVSFSSTDNEDTEWEKGIKSWYSEVEMFPGTSVDPFKFDKKLGHYTQVVWSLTDKVGCGFVMFKDGKLNKKLSICDYGPVGNTKEKAMYKKGKPCSACPEGTTCSKQFPGLCKAE